MGAARKSFARAFCFGGGCRGSNVAAGSVGGKRLLRGKCTTEHLGEGASLAATPPESPFPPGDDEELLSFFLLRHGQTNFNAIGRIQVCVSSYLPQVYYVPAVRRGGLGVPAAYPRRLSPCHLHFGSSRHTKSNTREAPNVAPSHCSLLVRALSWVGPACRTCRQLCICFVHTVAPQTFSLFFPLAVSPFLLSHAPKLPFTGYSRLVDIDGAGHLASIRGWQGNRLGR